MLPEFHSTILEIPPKPIMNKEGVQTLLSEKQDLTAATTQKMPLGSAGNAEYTSPGMLHSWAEEEKQKQTHLF